MIKDNKTMIAFYHKLGGLFFAVANADKVVRPEETEALRTIVKKEWLPLESSTDQFGTDAGFQIEAAFDWHQENNSTQKAILEDFKGYYENHPSLFSPHVKLLILKTAEAIAYAYAGENKSEQEVLRKITHILSGL